MMVTVRITFTLLLIVDIIRFVWIFSVRYSVLVVSSSTLIRYRLYTVRELCLCCSSNSQIFMLTTPPPPPLWIKYEAWEVAEFFFIFHWSFHHSFTPLVFPNLPYLIGYPSISVLLYCMYRCGHDIRNRDDRRLALAIWKGGWNVDKHNINYRMQTMTLFLPNMLVYSIINKTCGTLCHKATNSNSNNTTRARRKNQDGTREEEKLSTRKEKKLRFDESMNTYAFSSTIFLLTTKCRTRGIRFAVCGQRSMRQCVSEQVIWNWFLATVRRKWSYHPCQFSWNIRYASKSPKNFASYLPMSYNKDGANWFYCFLRKISWRWPNYTDVIVCGACHSIRILEGYSRKRHNIHKKWHVFSVLCEWSYKLEDVHSKK